jgi:cytochrome c1
MPTLASQRKSILLKTTVTAGQGGLTDQQIADIVAYLRSLK